MYASMNVCNMFVCMLNICMYVCINVLCTYARRCAFLYECMCIHMLAHIIYNIYKIIYIYVCVCVCVCLLICCMHTYVCLCIRPNALCKYLCTYSHMYICRMCVCISVTQKTKSWKCLAPQGCPCYT